MTTRFSFQYNNFFFRKILQHNYFLGVNNGRSTNVQMNKGRRGNESIPRRIRKESLLQAGNQTQASTASSRKALRGWKSQKSFFWANGSLQIDHLEDPLSVWGKSQTLHYIAAQPSRTRLSVVLFVKSKIFKIQFLPTFATRCKLSSHWCLKSRHSRS